MITFLCFVYKFMYIYMITFLCFVYKFMWTNRPPLSATGMARSEVTRRRSSLAGLAKCFGGR